MPPWEKNKKRRDILQLSRFNPDNICHPNQTIYVKHFFSNCKIMTHQNHSKEIPPEKLYPVKNTSEKILLLHFLIF